VSAILAVLVLDRPNDEPDDSHPASTVGDIAVVAVLAGK
jgi:hypothetical protein